MNTPLSDYLPHHEGTWEPVSPDELNDGDRVLYFHPATYKIKGPEGRVHANVDMMNAYREVDHERTFLELWGNGYLFWRRK